MSKVTAYLEIDTWEVLRESLVVAVPEISDELKRRKDSDWMRVAPRERGAIALALMLDQDPRTPAVRRRARALLRAFEHDGLISGEEGASSVREEEFPHYGDLDPVKRERIAASLAPLLLDSFCSDLGAISGPLGALEFVEKVSPQLRGRRAGRFLAVLGYPIAAAEKSQRRWLHRFGLIEEVRETRENRRQGMRVLMDLGERIGLPLAEIDVLIGAFTGSEPGWEAAALCTAKPRCGACPLARQCQYARFLEQHGKLDGSESGTRNLASAVLPEDRPREKLSRDGAGTLTNAELLAILLRTGSGREHAVDLASRILREAGSLDRLARFSISEMTRLPGLGPVKAVTIQAALELARRVNANDNSAAPAIASARDVFEYLRGYMLDRTKELFVCLLLNTKNRVMRRIVVSEGTLNQSLVHPREAFQEAIKDSAAAVIFAHNHPSGDPSPSRDDRLITARLVRAGDVVGVKVLDHVIVGRESYYSFADEGQLEG